MRKQRPKEITCNDRQFDQWRLTAITGEKTAEGFGLQKSQTFQVYAVPQNDARGAETSHFKIVINGIVVTSPDLIELRRKAQEIYSGVVEGDYVKVIVVKTRGDPIGDWRSEKGDEFGLEWQIGWQVARLGVVFDESRQCTISVENYEEPDEPDMASGIRIGAKVGHRGKQMHKTAVVPWTKEREGMLVRAVEAIGKMRDDFNAALLRPEEFAGLLDAKAGLLLGEAK